ncbi:MAG: hypothetical protein BWK75_03565 [Candidatus Altiarchaeales archaeon A3]|nr:MAG: hypothetical protein BWK75_03565 [Candidatus Altiarchaeales archaeon A3]
MCCYAYNTILYIKNKILKMGKNASGQYFILWDDNKLIVPNPDLEVENAKDNPEQEVDNDKKNKSEYDSFQRNEIWDNHKKSRLIDSLIRGIPIPPLYLTEEGNNYIVIDGQQRINAIVKFMDDELKLSGEDIDDGLKNKKYNNIKGNPKFSSLLLKATIPVIIIRTDDLELKYEIFARLNTGGMHINTQEIRNCIFHGSYNNLINELAYKNSNFSKLIAPLNPKRMKYSELILRFFAFQRLGPYPEDYVHPMKKFLDKEMKEHQNLDESDLKEKKENFENTVNFIGDVFGETIFKKFNIGTHRDYNGKYDYKICTGLFDVVMCGISRYVDKEEDKNAILKCKDIIREELLYLITADKDFINSIGDHNYEKLKVKTRFDKFFNSLSNIIKLPDTSFSLEIKKNFYKKDKKCYICDKEINKIDDTIIVNSDKNIIDVYWREGEKIPISAHLSHRYCYYNKNNILNKNSENNI